MPTRSPSLDTQNYEQLLRPYRRALQVLRLELEFFLDDYERSNLVAVEERVKTYASAVRKELSNTIPIAEQHDLAGLRIVTATLSDIDVVMRFFTRQVDGKDLRIIADTAVHRPPGYRARHLVVEVPPHYSRSPFEIPIEVQLRTALQHSFAFLSREWFYRAAQPMPQGLERRLQAVSGKLAAIDKEVDSIYSEFVVAAKASDDASPLTPAAYQAIARDRFSGEVVATGEAVDNVRFLSALGVRTCGAARRFFFNPLLERLLDRAQTMSDESHPWVQTFKVVRGTSHAYTMFAPRLQVLAEILQGTAFEDVFKTAKGEVI